MYAIRAIRLLPLLAALATPAALAGGKGDAANGKIVFEQLCSVCHAASRDGSGETRGPNLFGLIGRKAGSERDFAMYSPALQAFGMQWTAEMLDGFLADPATKVPGTTMPVTVPDSKERADLIAYLASLR